MEITYFAGIVFVTFVLFMLWRNTRVYDLRRKMTDQVFAFEDWEWRIKVYTSVQYDEMMYKFWKPVTPEAFYEDTSFLH